MALNEVLQSMVGMIEKMDKRIERLENWRMGDRSDWLQLTKAVARLDRYVSEQDQVESIARGKPRKYVSEMEKPCGPGCSPEQWDIELAEMRRAKQQGGGYAR